MAKKITLRCVLFIFIFEITGNASVGQPIFTNPITGTNPNTFNPYTTGENYDPNITVSGISRGAGIMGAAGDDRYNATGWNSATFDVNDYFEFTLNPNSGATINFSSFSYTAQASATGPTSFALRSSVDAFTSNIGTATATGITISLSAAAFQGIVGPITFRMYGWAASSTVGTFSVNDFSFDGSVLPTIPKYYRSQTSGDWNNVSTWQSSADNITWSNSTLVPGSSEKTITIQAGHVVTVSTPISLDETEVNGTLQVLSGGVLNINDGIGNDIDIQNNGILQVVSTDDYSATIIPGTSVINVATGGKIEIGDGVTSVGKDYETFATTNLTTWNNASEFEWNSPTLNIFKFSGNTYFVNPVAGVIPKFIVSKISGPIGASGDVTINGLFVVNSDVLILGSGRKFFRDGLSGNNTLTLDASIGACNIMSSTSEISGNLTLVINKDVHINNGTTITAGSTIVVSNTSSQGFVRDAGNFIINANATLDMGSSATITNTAIGNVTVNGTLVTAKTAGLMGIGATISAGSMVILNTGSTIEYNANAPQSIQGATLPNYYNVTFSGSGIKTLISNNNPSGTIMISGPVILDAGNFTFGTAGTNLTMAGTSRYITGGAGTKPDAQGIYNLGTGTTIEFALTSGTIIRLGLIPIDYANIIISGTDVSNTSLVTGITFQSGSIFLVEAGATFKLNNSAGFTGNTATAINITNNPVVTLETGSTIEYSGISNQTITNQVPYQNLTLSGSGIKTAPPGTLTVQGNLLTSGASTFAHNGGTVLLDGPGAQSFAGITYNNLILFNGIKATSGNATITDSIKINIGTILYISAADMITLHSDAAKTARVAQVEGSINYNATGKFVVERYISAKKAWRFLSIATNSSQTIKNAWQEGALTSGSNPAPGFGTQITSNRVSWLADGFDVFSANGASMKTYDPVINNYNGITATTASFLPGLGGYMTFIRGDRTAVAFGSPVTKTVLRSAGTLFTGTQPNISVVSGEVIPVNNPYASSIDLRKISTSFNIFYYVWDPNRSGIYGLGAFQTLSWNGTDYDVIPGNSGSYGAFNNFIESGQAFFVSTLGAGSSIQLQESAKSSAIFTISPFKLSGISRQQLRTNLYVVNPDTTTLLADGVLNDFGDYSNEVDGMDAKKLANFSETLSIKKGSILLAIERKHTVMLPDTVFLNLSGVKAQKYKFEFIADELNQDGLTAFLEDSYTLIKTPLSLKGNTIFDFNVTNDAGSYTVDRFRIVFVPAVVLPITYAMVKAYRANKNIFVEWKVENELNISKYKLERSTNSGQEFMTIAIISPTANNGHSAVYREKDTSPVDGYNYYRVKSENRNGDTMYSNVVKVLMGKLKDDITVFPNPVKGNIINLQFTNQPSGVYFIRLINKQGQSILYKRINHVEGNATEAIRWNYNIAHGNYQLEVTKPGASIKHINLLY